MAMRSKRYWLAATALALVFGAGLPGVRAFEQGPGTVVDPDKFSAASKAAEVNSTNQQSHVPDVSGATKTVTGQGNSQDGPGMVIPDLGKTSGGASDLNTPGAVPQPRSKNVPGFDVSNSGPGGVNLPGSTPENHLGDVDKLTGKMNQEALGLVDQATKGGPNGLNIPTESSADVTSADDTSGKKSGNGGSSKSGGSGSSKSGGSGSGKNDGWVPGVGGGGSVVNKDGTTTNTATVQDGSIISISTSTQNKDGSVTITYQQYNTKTKEFSPKATETTLPTKKGSTPSDDGSSSGRDVGGLSARSSLAKKNQGGGTDNNSETSSATGDLSPNSSYAKRLHGDGGGDAGDNNNPYKAGGLAAGSTLAKKDYGDGGGSDSRGGGGATSPITGKLKKVGGGGNGELAATTSSRVIGAGLLEGDSGFAQQGPAATGVRGPNAGAIGVVVKSRSN